MIIINYMHCIFIIDIIIISADNERSLPHFMDGLKPSQRKVLFACFKRNLKQEIKVAQLAGKLEFEDSIGSKFPDLDSMLVFLVFLHLWISTDSGLDVQ